MSQKASDGGQRPVEDSCEHGNERSSSINTLGNSWVAAQMTAFQERLSSATIDPSQGQARVLKVLPQKSQPIHQPHFIIL
jgi:hypothetical protein